MSAFPSEPPGLSHRAMGMGDPADSGDYHPSHPDTRIRHQHVREAPGMSASSTLHHPNPAAALTPSPPCPTSSTSSPPPPSPPILTLIPTRGSPETLGSFTMREDRSLAPMNSLYPAYHHKDPCIQSSVLVVWFRSGQHTHVPGRHPPYAHPGAAMPGEKMLTPAGSEAHYPPYARQTHGAAYELSAGRRVQIN
ncbi:hepatocyte nuclear factor 6 isoform X1 [Lates japonicus]|uniref:Hepatocyte nuclear factor 6 isoform X1 n=1 Tax=Lates japonicus TaxID=270547 RepID=A0AAD3NJW9_LATJO|nr:hepatocyte nuclear factor 6 isoform X1 [Lates japonicus]